MGSQDSRIETVDVGADIFDEPRQVTVSDTYNADVAEGSHKGLWFKVHSNPPPASNLLVGLKVCASNGEVQQSGTVMILKHESHSADFFLGQNSGRSAGCLAGN